MDELRGRYRVPYRDLEVQVGTSSAVLSQTFVSQSLRRERRKKDDLDAARGAVNALLISIAFWVALGFAIFSFS